MLKKMYKERLINSCMIVLMIMLSSCAAMSQKHHKHVESYYEDLSTVHPSFKPAPVQNTSQTQTPVKLPPEEIKFVSDISKPLNQKLDSIAWNNKKYTTAQGYRILIYAGSSSAEALKMKQQVYMYTSDLKAYDQYKQPSFRVKVGDFSDRIEASYVLNEVKENFPNAMIVPDQINLAK